MNELIYDIGIIGGGIAGAGIARDAAMRGAKVVVFEKNTFGSGTSSKTSKLIHGGIRYLETAWLALKQADFKKFWKNFRFVFLALRETFILERIAPDLVQPVSLLSPIYHHKGRSKWAVYFGTLIYSFLAALSGGRRFPHFLSSAEEVLKEIPDFNPHDLAAAVVFWDHWTYDQKLVIETMRSAERQGAALHEHSKVVGYRKMEDRYEVSVEQNGQRKNFYCRKLINASGPWIDQVRGSTQEWVLPVAGSHIMLRKFIAQSLVLQAEDDRIFFVINMEDRARVGTTERLEKNPDTVRPSEEEIDYLLRSLNHYFPSRRFSRSDILSADAGVRPLVKSGGQGSFNSISREHEIKTDGVGVLHVIGVKLTDHRRAAEEVVDKLIPELSKFFPGLKKRSLTAKFPLK